MPVDDPSFFALYRLLLNRQKVFAELLDKPGEFQAALKAHTSVAERDLLMKAAEADLRWLEAKDHHLVLMGNADYPECLAEIYEPPPLLFARGNLECLSNPAQRIAMVGARKASHHGLKQAERMASDIACSGITVVSGLALGIDAACHEGALDAGGTTIAVLGIGCDAVYPRRNWRLADRVARSGLILSEFPTGIHAIPANFPRRNRIVIGLCLGTLVIEAALRSGSLVSARLASAEGREVMAMPGLVTNAQARGCHQLIREGATLVESSADVFRELGLEADSRLNFSASLEPEQWAVLESLSSGPQSIDSLLATHTCPVEELTVTLVSLEVLGLITSNAGRYELNDVAID